MKDGNLYKEEGKSRIPSIQFAYNAPEDFGLWQIKGGWMYENQW